MSNKIKLKQFDESQNQLKQDVIRRTGMDRRKRNLMYMVFLLIGVVLLFMFVPLPLRGSLNWMFSDPLRPAEYGELFRYNFEKIACALSGQETEALLKGHERMAYYYHIHSKNVDFSVAQWLRDYVGAMFAGASLAVTGATFQGTFRNSIASPTTLGVMSGGTVGVTIWIMWASEWFDGRLNTLFESLPIPFTGQMIFVLAGCFGAVLFTLGVATAAGRGKPSMVTLIVTGMVFSAAVSSFSQVVQMYQLMWEPYGTKTNELRYAMQGHIYFQSNAKLLVFIIPTAVLLLIMLGMAKRLNLIVFGEEEARAMGINVKRTRNVLLIICTILTAYVITNCGAISFVGLIVPHLVRRIVGSDCRYLIPGSILTGALFLVIVDHIPPCSWMGGSIVGTYSSIAGGIAFLYLVIKNRRKSHADWA